VVWKHRRGSESSKAFILRSALLPQRWGAPQDEVRIVHNREPTGPLFGGPDSRLRVPTKIRLVGAARKSVPLPTLQLMAVDQNPFEVVSFNITAQLPHRPDL
jgi:hypothetical protein